MCMYITNFFDRGLKKNLRPLQDEARAKIPGIGLLDDLVAKGPVGEVGGGITGDKAALGIEAFGAILAKPIPQVVVLDDAAAVGLYMLAAVVGPDFTGTDELGSAGGGRRHC